MSIYPFAVWSFRLNDNTNTVICLKYKTRYELCSTFMRLQEFYESPEVDIKEKYFSIETIMDVYAKRFKNFSYTMDWSGFNVPGDVFVKWGDLFYDSFLDKERNLFEAVCNELNDQGCPFNDSFYVIGVYEDCPKYEVTLYHEMCHAFFRYIPDYRIKMTKFVEDLFKKDNPQYAIASYIEKILKEWGYNDFVIVDEIQAYLATSRDSELKENFKLENFEIREKFASLFLQTVNNQKVILPPIPSDEIIEERRKKYRIEYGYNAGEFV